MKAAYASSKRRVTSKKATNQNGHSQNWHL